MIEIRIDRNEFNHIWERISDDEYILQKEIIRKSVQKRYPEVEFILVDDDHGSITVSASTVSDSKIINDIDSIITGIIIDYYANVIY